MSTRITVRLAGRLGLDDADRLRATLERETGLEWSRESRAGDDHLSGIETIILTALVTGAATEVGKAAARQVTEQVKSSVERLKSRYLSHPPDVTVQTSETDDDELPLPGEALPARPGDGN